MRIQEFFSHHPLLHWFALRRRGYTHTFEQTVCLRKRDNTLWIASSNGLHHSMRALFGLEPRFYFRHVHKLHSLILSDFQQCWAFDSADEFDIVMKTKIWAPKIQWRKHLYDP